MRKGREEKENGERLDGREACMVSEELRGSTKCKLEEWCLSLSSTPLLPFSLELTPIKGSNHKDLPKKLVEATRGLHVANSSCVMKH